MSEIYVGSECKLYLDCKHVEEIYFSFCVIQKKKIYYDNGYHYHDISLNYCWAFLMSKILDSKLNNQLIGFFLILMFFYNQEIKAEMIIGKAFIEPGVDLIFEGGVKDEIMPEQYYLSENQTDVHIEVLANWSSSAPKGSPEGGHVAYLNITAIVINETTGTSDTHKLTPHVNMSDNLHYAKNIKLPGKIDELYTVIFEIRPPKNDELGMHYDWRYAVDNELIVAERFEFNNLDFKEIALSKRR